MCRNHSAQWPAQLRTAPFPSEPSELLPGIRRLTIHLEEQCHIVNSANFFIVLNANNVCEIDKLMVRIYWLAMDFDWIYRDIGNVVRRRRKKLGMTQEKLAPLVGFSRASVANIETGRQKLLVHQIYALAEALQLVPEDLLPRAKRTPSPTEVELPADLSSLQKEQVSQFIMDTSSEEESNGG
jgi:transcriptional regulator with XRE-family HTH domain